MSATPFSKITQALRRQNWLLFGLLPVFIILASGFYWGAQRIIAQEQGRFALDFSTLIGYVNEQELFLRRLQSKNAQQPPMRLQDAANFREIIAPPDWNGRLFEGQESVADLPFSWLCGKEFDCSQPPENVFDLGSYLADFYSSFWASSYFPASVVFFVTAENNMSISVPVVDVAEGDAPLSAKTYMSVTNSIREHLSNISQEECKKTSVLSQDVLWFRPSGLSDQLVGLISAGFPLSVSGPQDHPDCIYAATLFSPSRIGELERTIYPLIENRFWLQHQSNFWLQHHKFGTLIGNGNVPEVETLGIHFTRAGLVFKIVDNPGTWTGYYLVSYMSFFQDHQWLPVSAAIILILSIFSGMAYARWYSRRVIQPAQEAQREILESDEFNRTLIQTAPIALSLFSRHTGQLVFANALAVEWLGIELGQRLPTTQKTEQIISAMLSANNTGVIEQLEVTVGRTLYVAYSPTRYKQQDVILCAFADVSAHVEIERNLAIARAAADDASEAKSIFLATMSHEIRTPLYGALGTLELLSLTQLNDQQRQFVDRIEGASQTLMQLISDILDISKIEAGQLQLESVEFNPRELVQNCTASYSAMAHRKGLLLFSLISTDVPPLVWGDPARLRQILNNLLSNAIKFTDSGYVIVRLSQTGSSDDSSRLLIEVLDSGLGIAKAQQENLFTPFYLIEANRHTVSGTGLGLSICARLAELMGTEIQLISEPQLGSKFYFEVDLQVRENHSDHLHQPQLQGASILVRTPHPELTHNVCAWLQHWGALALPAPEPLPMGEENEILLDIQRQPQKKPHQRKGIQLVVPLSGLAETYSDIDAHSLSSIGFAVDRLLHGQQRNASLKPLLPQFNLRVLVAEDNPLNQITLQGQLEQLGCEVTLASDGEEALALWDIAPHDIVLTDVNMPYLNGYELASKLRSEGMNKPIIGVTANAMLDEQKRCIEVGMNACLVKPIELKDLAETFRKFIEPERILNEVEDDAYLALLEPNILDKHRAVFLKSMEEDLKTLEQNFSKGDADMVGATLHRMRGALVLAQQRDLAARMEILELQMQTSGLDDKGVFRVLAVMAEIRQLLTNIESTR